MVGCLLILIYCMYMVYDGLNNPTYSAGCYIFNQYENISTKNETEFQVFINECIYYNPNINYREENLNKLLTQKTLEHFHNISH